MTWDELGDVFNQELREDDQWYDQSAYRKPYQQAKNYYEDVFAKMVDGQYADDIQARKRELEKERKKIQTEKVEYNKWLREEARDELIAEKLCDAVAKLEPLEIPEPIVLSDSDNSKGWVLAFGDAHYGAEFEIKGLMGEIINAYNPDIFQDRMNQLLSETINIVEKENIEYLRVFNLGDSLDGLLRVGQLARLRYGVVESTVRFAHYLSSWLNILSKYCVVDYAQCLGNHSELRMLGQKKGTFEDENMEKIIMYIIQTQLADNPNVIISENETGMIFSKVAGNNILGWHGESKDLEQSLKDFTQIYGTKIDVMIAGHLHHSFSETVGVMQDVMRTPSIIGIDDYSMKLHKTSNPGATLFAVEADKGKTCEYHIKL